jgi:D-aminopeptidase
VAEGVVGAGTGMSCLGYKGGIGTSSRVVGEHTLGVLALTNFGAAARFTVDGVPVGRLLPLPPDEVEDADDADDSTGPGEGSCIVVVATDAPLSHSQCERVARRAGLGLARTGSIGGHASGEIFCSFSTTARRPRSVTAPVVEWREVAMSTLNGLFTATVDATEEAVLNSLFVADTVVGRRGHRSLGVPHDAVLDLLRAQGRSFENR